jgi:hypothetical protein
MTAPERRRGGHEELNLEEAKIVVFWDGGMGGGGPILATVPIDFFRRLIGARLRPRKGATAVPQTADPHILTLGAARSGVIQSILVQPRPEEIAIAEADLGVAIAGTEEAHDAPQRANCKP